MNTFVSEAVNRFVQSVVFIDDEIYYPVSGMPVSDTISLPAPPNPFGSETEDNSNDTSSIESSDSSLQPSFHPKNIVDSFAEYGTICALYEPSEDVEIQKESNIFKVCERADIAILDWDLFSDNGERVKQLISLLVQHSSEFNPHQVRLCVIYTTSPHLSRVTESVLEKMRQEGHVANPLLNSSTIVDVGPTRILVLGKVNAPGRLESEKEEAEVAECDLAIRVLEEFGKMNSGLLQSYALYGISAIRNNSKRILDKFHSNLDGAFLLHRAFIMGSEDAFDQLPELLTDELRAIIEDSLPSHNDCKDFINEVIDSLPLRISESDWTDLNDQPIDVRPYIIDFLKEGKKSLKAKRKICKQIGDLPKSDFRGIKPETIKAIKYIVDSDNAYSNDLLATLFSHRTQYAKKYRTLTFGTVVRFNVEGQWKYALCIMPLCDCIRLKNEVRFPFWELRGDVYEGNNGQRRGIVVLGEDNNPIGLSASGKPRDRLLTEVFTVDTKTGTVTTSEDGNLVFPSRGFQMEWVAQLKPIHVQRIIQDIAQNISRVGLVEAEWLRLLCDR